MKRRDILKSAGCTLFLPALESFGQERWAPAEADVKRLFCVSMGYGFFHGRVAANRWCGLRIQ